jgi:NADPH:quinone reductase-like Zn-dependent oxidoreductase
MVVYSAAAGRQVPLDLFLFYRRRLRLIGENTIVLNATDCARILTSLTPLFESGTLRPPSIAGRYPLSRAAEAYERVAAGAPGKIVLVPDH